MDALHRRQRSSGGSSAHTGTYGSAKVEPLSTPVKTSPPLASLSASSWTSDITLTDGGVIFSVTRSARSM